MLDLTTCYREALKEKQLKKKVQSRLDSFFVKKSSAPPATPSLEVTPNPDSPEPLPGYESEPEPEPVPAVTSPAASPALSDLFGSDDSPDPLKNSRVLKFWDLLSPLQLHQVRNS
ncbi:ankyrin repeat and KH domain-containing protein mask-1-like [Macrobrachium rosenbergii]|uniref:ankyrin repeat and KH domain-containing protein mask-1-like n=1 Tax=Macrobrachium rosenbergii TaxID=79674 RepID=UPI0034D4BCAE